MKRIICLFTVLVLSFCLFAACVPENPPSDSSDVTSSETEKTGIDLLLDGAPEEIVAPVKEYSEKFYTTDSFEGFVKALTYLLKHNRFDVLAELQEKTNMKFDYSKIGKDVHISEASYSLKEKGDYYAVYTISYEVTKSKISGISIGQQAITVDVEKLGDVYVFYFMPGRQNMTSVLRKAGWDKLFANFVIVFNNEGYPKFSEKYEKLELFMANAVILLDMEATVENYNALMEKYLGLKNYYYDAGVDEEGHPLIKDVYDNVMPFFQTDHLLRRLWKVKAGITASGTGRRDYAFIDVSTYDDDFALHITGSRRYEFRKYGEGYILDNPFVDEDPYFEKLIKELPEDIAVAIDSYARKGFTEKAPEEAAKALVYLLNNNRFDIMGEMLEHRQFTRYDHSMLTDKVTVSDASYTLVSEEDGYYYTYTYLIEYTIADTLFDDYAPGKHYITVTVEKTDNWIEDGEYRAYFQAGDQKITDVLKADGWDKLFNIIYYYYVYYYAYEKQTFDKVDPEFLGEYITALAWCLGLEDGTASGYNEAVKRCFGIEGFLTDAGKDEDGNILATDIYGRTLTLGIIGDVIWPLYRWDAGIIESGVDGDGAYIRVAVYDDVAALHVVAVKTFSFALKDGHYYLKSVE